MTSVWPQSSLMLISWLSDQILSVTETIQTTFPISLEKNASLENRADFENGI